MKISTCHRQPSCSRGLESVSFHGNVFGGSFMFRILLIILATTCPADVMATRAAKTKAKSTNRTQTKIPDEQRLYQALMTDYQNSVRPVFNVTQTVYIDFVLKLNQIMGLDEKHQVLTTSVFIDQRWKDEYLTWSIDAFNGIRTMRIPADQVWLPDTFVFNNADDTSTGFMTGNYVLVTADGMVTWPVPVKMKSSCKVDIKYFPFDDQECLLRFGSWIHTSRWLEVVGEQKSADTEHYVDNSEWQLISAAMKRMQIVGPDTKTELIYRLHIRRRTFYYIFNIIVPCTMLSILTLLTFWIPTTSGEKVTLGLSVFLAFSMFMVLIAEQVPATSESVPLIGIYLTAVMTMTSVSVIMAVIVINIHDKGQKCRAAPRWLCNLCFQFLSKLMFVKHDIPKLASLIKLPYEREEKDKGDSLLIQAFQQGRQQSSIKGQGYMRPVCQDRARKPFEYDLRSAFELVKPKTFSTIRRTESKQSSLRASSMKRHHSQKRRQRLNSEDSVEDTCLITTNEQTDYDVTNPAMTSLDDSTPAPPPPPPPPPRSAGPSSSSSTSHHGGHPRAGKFFKTSNNPPTPTADVQFTEEFRQKTIIAEWQRIAAVIDRLLFWIFFIATVMSYIVILVVLPRMKPKFED